MPKLSTTTLSQKVVGQLLSTLSWSGREKKRRKKKNKRGCYGRGRKDITRWEKRRKGREEEEKKEDGKRKEKKNSKSDDKESMTC